MAIITRSRLYIDCPYCRIEPKGKIGSIYEYGEKDSNSIFIKFERCPVYRRQTEARLGHLREISDGKDRHTPEIRPKSNRPRIRSSKGIHKARKRNK